MVGLVRSGDRLGTREAFEFMRVNQARCRIGAMARVLGVSPSGFYAWRDREPSRRRQSDDVLKACIGNIHQRSRGTYGAPRIHAELAEDGVHVGRKRVARLMREMGLAGISRRKATRTTRRDDTARPAPDLVERRFEADAPDQLWVADITYVPTWAGFLFLAVVVDAFSRRVVGWSMANHLRTELVLEALNMALWRRRPERVVHHSDQGCQYTSYAFGKRCREMGVVPSMGSVGGRLLRDGRELLRHPRMRAHRPPQVSDPGRVRIPVQADHRIRRKPITHSDSSRSLIPDEPDHRFRSQADHFSAVTGIVPGVRCEGARGAG